MENEMQDEYARLELEHFLVKKIQDDFLGALNAVELISKEAIEQLFKDLMVNGSFLKSESARVCLEEFMKLCKAKIEND